MPSLTSKSSKITIVDVAEHSHVSPATVSLVLRNKGNVNAATRERVFNSAQKLGYLPSPSLPKTALKSVGLVLKVRANEVMAMNNFYAPVLAGIEELCRKFQINLLYANMPVDEENNPMEIPRLMLEAEVDGFLIVGMYLNARFINSLRQTNRPVVLVDGYADDDQFDVVVSANEVGGYEATRYLIEQGHQQIAMIGSQTQSYPSIFERRQGYARAMREGGLTPHFMDCPFDGDDVPRVLKACLQEYGGITAVFASNDNVAISTIQTAQSMGLRVPEDLSIIGFDNIELAQHIKPGLTTMRVDKTGMGRLAVQALFNRVDNPEAGGVHMVIRPNLIARESVMLTK